METANLKLQVAQAASITAKDVAQEEKGLAELKQQLADLEFEAGHLRACKQGLQQQQQLAAHGRLQWSTAVLVAVKEEMQCMGTKAKPAAAAAAEDGTTSQVGHSLNGLAVHISSHAECRRAVGNAIATTDITAYFTVESPWKITWQKCTDHDLKHRMLLN